MSLLKPRSASFVLYQGDDIERLSELYRAVEQARKANARAGEDARAGDDEPLVLRERQDEYDAFVDEAAERAVTVRVQMIGGRRNRDLMAEHPPRMVMVKGEPTTDDEGNSVETEREVMHEDDEQFGVNTDTYGLALLTYVDEASPEIHTLAEPQFATPAERMDFLDMASDDDLYTWWTTAFYLNTVQSADPKAARSSTVPSSLET